jgi:hypothetical protein
MNRRNAGANGVLSYPSSCPTIFTQQRFGNEPDSIAGAHEWPRAVAASILASSAQTAVTDWLAMHYATTRYRGRRCYCRSHSRGAMRRRGAALSHVRSLAKYPDVARTVRCEILVLRARRKSA